MPISKAGKTLIQFNVKNGQFKTADGDLTSLTWLTRISLDRNISTQAIYGDGELQLNLMNDKGYTGSLGMTARDLELEKALGLQVETQNGLAEVQQTSVVPISLYFETDFVGADGTTKTKKVWLYNVEITPPNEALDQSTDDINPATVEYGITVKGVYLKASSGDVDYIDPVTGNKIKVFKLTSVPTDAGYSTFGDSVPVPIAKAAEGGGGSGPS